MKYLFVILFLVSCCFGADLLMNQQRINCNKYNPLMKKVAPKVMKRFGKEGVIDYHLWQKGFPVKNKEVHKYLKSKVKRRKVKFMRKIRKRFKSFSKKLDNKWKGIDKCKLCRLGCEFLSEVKQKLCLKVCDIIC